MASQLLVLLDEVNGSLRFEFFLFTFEHRGLLLWELCSDNSSFFSPASSRCLSAKLSGLLLCGSKSFSSQSSLRFSIPFRFHDAARYFLSLAAPLPGSPLK